MRRPSDVRLTIYAAVTVIATVLFALVTFGVLPDEAGIVLLVLLAVPVFISWGVYQADLVTNEQLDDGERQRWRIAFAVLPPAMALYWLQHVRDRRID